VNTSSWSEWRRFGRSKGESDGVGQPPGLQGVPTGATEPGESVGDEGRSAVELFLDQVALVSDLDQAEVRSDRVSLMTAHSAKGLEFHTVFIIRALEGVLPSRYALKEEGGVDEELRLFYVAVTRAEDDLFISYPMTQYRRYQGEYMTDPSRFVTGIPEETLEPVQLVEDEEAEPSDEPLLDGDTPAALDNAATPKQLTDGSNDAEASSDTGKSDKREYEARDVDGLPF